MNFLGVGPGEIFLILILLLVVVGPERLPEFARSAGRFVVRMRNWIASSPDAQLVLRARDELEQELDELRRSLTEEVETVRKELETVRGDLAEATRLVEESAEEVARTRIELEEAGAVPADDQARTIGLGDAPATPATPEPAAEATGAADLGGVNPGPVGGSNTVAEREAANGQPVPRSFKPGQAPPPATPAPAATAEPSTIALRAGADDAIEALDARIRELSDEFARQLDALNAELAILRAQASVPPATPADVSVTTIALPADSLRDPAPAAAEARRRCKGLTRSGEPCGSPPLRGQDYCRAHASQQVPQEVTP